MGNLRIVILESAGKELLSFYKLDWGRDRNIRKCYAEKLEEIDWNTLRSSVDG
jgi:hypothetical protein